MPDVIAPPPDMATAVAGWIARLNHLRDDVAFGLDPRGITASLADVVADMQDVRKQTVR